MEFEWDENKNKTNIKKHGIDFKDAPAIWKGGLLEIGRNRAHGEERITVVGTLQGYYVTVIYTERDGSIRLISARPSNRKERPHR